MTDTSLLAVLSRALIHVIRGDLSVITNDLTYLGGVVSEEEVARAKARCANIAQFVGKLAVLQNSSETRPATLVELLRAAPPAGDLTAGSMTSIIGCNAQQGSFVFMTLSALLGSGEGTGKVTSAVDVKDGVCRLLLAKERTDELLGSYPTLSGFALRARGERSVVDAAICDLILQASGWRSGVAVTDMTVEISMEIAIAS